MSDTPLNGKVPLKVSQIGTILKSFVKRLEYLNFASQRCHPKSGPLQSVWSSVCSSQSNAGRAIRSKDYKWTIDKSRGHDWKHFCVWESFGM